MTLLTCGPFRTVAILIELVLSFLSGLKWHGVHGNESGASKVSLQSLTHEAFFRGYFLIILYHNISNLPPKLEEFSKAVECFKSVDLPGDCTQGS